MLFELKNIRKASGLSQVEAAKRLDVPLGTYRNWEQCIYMPRDNAQLKAIADLFHVSMEALFGYDLVLPGALSDSVGDDEAFLYVPVYGDIAAGRPIEMETVDMHFPIPREVMKRHPRAFLLIVRGTSMNRVLPDGSYALVDPDDRDPIVSGKPYAVCVNGYSATIKRVYALANGFKLSPDSTDPTHRERVYDYGEEGTEVVTVIGRVVWYTLPFDYEI